MDEFEKMLQEETILDYAKMDAEFMRDITKKAQERVERDLSRLTLDLIFTDMCEVMLDKIYFAGMNVKYRTELDWAALLSEVGHKYGIELTTPDLQQTIDNLDVKPMSKCEYRKEIPKEDWDKMRSRLLEVLEKKKFRIIGDYGHATWVSWTK